VLLVIAICLEAAIGLKLALCFKKRWVVARRGCGRSIPRATIPVDDVI